MRAAFDQVRARAPEFERANEMADGYFEYAKTHADTERDRALLGLRRAERIGKDAEKKKRIQSLLLALEAERRAERGISDKSLLKQAVDIDPENARAREALLGLSRAAPPPDRGTRYAVAAAIGLSALLGVLFILLRPRTPIPKAPAPDERSG